MRLLRAKALLSAAVSTKLCAQIKPSAVLYLTSLLGLVVLCNAASKENAIPWELHMLLGRVLYCICAKSKLGGGMRLR